MSQRHYVFGLSVCQCVHTWVLRWKHSLIGLPSTSRWKCDDTKFVGLSSRHLYMLLLLHTHTHTRLTALFSGLPGWAGTRKVKPIWILLKQETMSGSGISWAICKSAPCCRQITTPAPHHSVFYRPDDLPAAQPTASKNTEGHQYVCC